MPMSLSLDSVIDHISALFADNVCDVLILGENHSSIEHRVLLHALIPFFHEQGFGQLAIENPAHQTPCSCFGWGTT